MIKKEIIYAVLITFIFLIPISAWSQLGVKLGNEKSGPAPTIAYAYSDETSFLGIGGAIAIRGPLELNIGITYPIGNSRGSDLTTLTGGASVYLLNKEKSPIAISFDVSYQYNENSDALTVIGSTLYLGSRQDFLLSLSPLYLIRDRIDKRTGLSIAAHIMGDRIIISPFYTFLPERSFNNSIGISLSYIIQKKKIAE